MKVSAFKTDKITPESYQDITQVLDEFLPAVKENSILAVTSKIVSITEGQVVKAGGADKDKLIEQESQYYLPKEENTYNISLTIAKNTLIGAAGIDGSNGGDYLVLWPKDPFESANKIRQYLKNRFKVKNIGVIITDSKTTPLRWGVTAFALSYSGFKPLKDYIGKPDIFGKLMLITKMSIIDNLACSAAVVMGEGAEQTPLALLEDLPFVEFQDSNPTEVELKNLQISPDGDLYTPLLKNVPWKKGKKD